METTLTPKVNFKFAALSLVMALFLSSCYTARVYAPHKQNIPGLRQKHDMRAAFGYAGASDPADDVSSKSMNGLSLQGAYAATGRIGVLVNYSNVGEGKDNRIRSVEAGIGYFAEIQSMWIFEAYGGIGFGKALGSYRDGLSLVYSGTQRHQSIFLQPSILFQSKHFGIALALKASSVDFHGLTHSDIPDSEAKEFRDQIHQLRRIDAQGRYFMLQPSLTIRGGLRNVKAEIQIGGSAMDADLRKHAYSVFGSVGLFLSLSPIKRSQSCPDFGCK